MNEILPCLQDCDDRNQKRTTLFKGQGSENPLQVRVIKNHGNGFLYHTVELALKKSVVSCGFGEQKSPASSWRKNHRNEFLSDMVELALTYKDDKNVGLGKA